MSGCGSEACGCGAASTARGAARNIQEVSAGFCPSCSTKAHPVSPLVLPNILKAEPAETYCGKAPNLCLNPVCDVVYFDLDTNQVFDNRDCETGVWFKEHAQNSYICYCQKITEKEIIEAVVETGLDDLGSVMLYLREDVGEDCAELQPAAVPCNRYFQEAIEKAQIVREALLHYKDLEPDSKEAPHELIEARYNKYVMEHSGAMAGASGCCGGGCSCA